MGRARTESSIPSSYSADYFQRGKDYAEKLRKGRLQLLLVIKLAEFFDNKSSFCVKYKP